MTVTVSACYPTRVCVPGLGAWLVPSGLDTVLHYPVPSSLLPSPGFLRPQRAL